jgi:hypothetical protein
MEMNAPFASCRLDRRSLSECAGASGGGRRPSDFDATGSLDRFEFISTGRLAVLVLLLIGGGGGGESYWRLGERRRSGPGLQPKVERSRSARVV